MQKCVFKRQLYTLTILPALILGISQDSLSQSIDEKFPSIKQPASAPYSKATQHFVRLNLAPVSQWVKEQKSSGLNPEKSSINAYAQMLDKKIAENVAKFEAAGFTVSGLVSVSDVGFSVFATKSDMLNMKSTDGVKEIIPQQTFTPQRDYSTPWVGAPAAHSSGYSGEGQVIAVIDTGIDYTHADFGGNGDPNEYEINDPSVIEDGTFPTNRVIGGFDFAGFDYNASAEETSIPQPDNDPLDDGQHGTHVSGIAAGGGVEGVLDSGIAPEASLMALKVFGANGSTNLTSLAIEMAMDPNGDGDPSDAVDVINMSLGSPFGNPNDPASIASQSANDAGIVVVASAGNSGNEIPFVSGSPGSADGVITVASTIPGGVPAFFVPFTLTSGETLEYFAAYSGISPPLEEAIEGEVVLAEPFDACTALTSDLTGKIALITRGACAFTDKLNFADDAGAIAAIVVNSVEGAPIVMGGTDVELRGAMISLADGTELLSELAIDTVTAELAADNTKLFLDDDDTISGFSSRGPGPTGLFKPDVSAPGSLITSAQSGSGTGTLTISGTSMAAPQVAGMAAILQQKFPQLEPQAIKAIIQNTARPAVDNESPTGTPPLSLQGTGIIDIEKALTATSYVAPGGIGFGRIKPEYNQTVRRSITVNNFSNTAKRYQITTEPNNTLPTGAARLSTTREIFLEAGRSRKITVSLDLNAQLMESGIGYTELDGWIVVSSGDEVMRVGYQALIDPASKLNYNVQSSGSQKTANLTNVAFGEGRASAFTFSAESQEQSDNPQTLDAFGSRIEGNTLLFGLNAQENWTNFSRKALTMEIDTNNDAEVDYVLFVADQQFFDPVNISDPTGLIISGLFNVNEDLPAIVNNLQYVAATEFNSSVLQFRIDAYGIDGFLRDDQTSFNYTLTLSDLFGDIEDGQLSGSIDLVDNLTFDTADVVVPSQQSVSVNYVGNSALLWLVPSEASSGRAAYIR